MIHPPLDLLSQKLWAAACVLTRPLGDFDAYWSWRALILDEEEGGIQGPGGCTEGEVLLQGIGAVMQNGGEGGRVCSWLPNFFLKEETVLCTEKPWDKSRSPSVHSNVMGI